MSQQINLYNPIFRPQKLAAFSSTGILYGAGITAALCAFAALYEDAQLRAVQTQARVTDQAQKDATALYEKAMAEVGNKQPNKQLDAELATLDAQLKRRQEIAGALSGGALGNTSGFSEYMRAFSRQSITGLWLTGFDITPTELALQGRTLSADLVATYLKQLNQEKLLQGRSFATLRISQPRADPGGQLQTGYKADENTKGQQEDQKAATPRYLEFTISTIEASAGSQRTTQSAPSAPLLGDIDSSPTSSAAQAASK